MVAAVSSPSITQGVFRKLRALVLQHGGFCRRMLDTSASGCINIRLVKLLLILVCRHGGAAIAIAIAFHVSLLYLLTCSTPFSSLFSVVGTWCIIFIIILQA